ncbi:EF-hand domain-containing protein [Prosthecobacter sp.]|uniref:EF-hand domain-containing protein n=1 Tax=Prosthecobacter sp. TaxID=1965333 RepID=UPI0037832A53
MKVITSLLAILALSAVTSFAADGDAPKKAEGDKGKPKFSPEEMFAKLDTDKDGKISKAEFMASPGAKKDEAKAAERFGKMDKNSDGSLTKDEMTPKKKKDA